MKFNKLFVILLGAMITLGIGMITSNQLKASANVKTEKINAKQARHFVTKKRNKKFIHNHDINASLSKKDALAKKWIAWNESKNHYHAHNGIYYGKYQLGMSLLHGDYSPKNQELAANKYVSSRYGTWSNAKRHWLRCNWY